MVESNQALRGRCLHPSAAVQMHMPATVGDYTGERRGAEGRGRGRLYSTLSKIACITATGWYIHRQTLPGKGDMSLFANLSTMLTCQSSVTVAVAITVAVEFHRLLQQSRARHQRGHHVSRCGQCPAAQLVSGAL